MKKVINTNWFWIIFIVILGGVLEVATDFNALVLLGLILVWIVTVFYHECGHWFFAKTRQMELFMISSFAGMYMNGRWYFSIPAYISWGMCGMYKPLRNGRMTKRDAIWYIAGGMIFNLIAVVILFVIRFIFSIENELLDFTILMNGVIMIATAIPTKNNDGGRLLSLLRGNLDELKALDSANYLFSLDISAQEILDEVSLENKNDYMASYVRNLAFIDIESNDDFENVYSTKFTERHNINLRVIQAFQAMYKYADGQELESHEIEVFNDQASVYAVPFNKLYRFFERGEREYLVYFEKHVSHFPSGLENKVFMRALEAF